MPRDAQNRFYYTPGTEAVSGQEATASQFNTRTDEAKEELNAILPVSRGGTGASTAAAARTELGVPSLTENNTFTGLQAVQIAGDNKILLKGSDGPYVAFYNAADARVGTVQFNSATELFRVTWDGAATMELSKAGVLRVDGVAVRMSNQVPAATAIGARVMAKPTDPVAFGVTCPGSNLTVCNAAGQTAGSPPALSGTWRCEGYGLAETVNTFIRTE